MTKCRISQSEINSDGDGVGARRKLEAVIIPFRCLTTRYCSIVTSSMRRTGKAGSILESLET